MSPGLALLLLAAGVALLALGASWLVDGASRLALRFGISPMVVGLTVVGFGTSMPELTVSLLAAARGSAGLSLGNAVGSNVANLLLVLGAAALLGPLVAAGSRRQLLRDLGFGLAPATVLLVAGWDGFLGRPTALALLAIFVAFMATCLSGARDKDDGERIVVAGSTPRLAALTVAGIALLVIGSELMVRGGVSLAAFFGVSEAVVGLTVVAIGTSLPELATSVAAALKRETEISIGNVLGSNVFNLGMIIGTAFAIRPAAVPVFVIRQDIPMLAVITVLLGCVILVRGGLGRRVGAAMLATFAAYLVFVMVRGG